MILTFIGLIAGSFITWLVAWLYYERASRDLSLEAAELRKMNILMLRGLETAGIAEFSRDAEGNIQGMKINASSSINAGTASMKCDVLVTSKKNNS